MKKHCIQYIFKLSVDFIKNEFFINTIKNSRQNTSMKNRKRFSSEHGFSMVELIVVVLLIFITTSMSIFLLSGRQKAYKPDEQSAKIGDLMQEARQRSLTQRETMRVEINLDKGTARLIDENGDLISDGNGDDKELKKITLLPGADVKFNKRPDNITQNPPEPIQVDPVVFYLSDYPGSELDKVVTFRFKRNGTITDKTDTPYSGSLHIWSPKSGNTENSEIARSITFLGSSGLVRFWEWNVGSPDANKWKNSRR